MTTSTSPARPAPPAQVPELPADLAAGLRRLKLATVRRLAPELLLTAKTQRWTPEEVLRTLVDAELTARDASNTANRLKAATFPPRFGFRPARLRPPRVDPPEPGCIRPGAFAVSQSNAGPAPVSTPQQPPMSTALAHPWLLVPGSAHSDPFSARQATCSSKDR